MAIVSLFDVSAFVYRGMSVKMYNTKYAENFPVGGLSYLMRRVARELVGGVHVALFMDSRTDRNVILPEYKSDRNSPDFAVANQLNALVDLCGICGIPVYKEDNCEADDLIASAAEYTSKIFDRVYVHSGDADLTHNIDYNVEFKSVDENVNSLTIENYRYGLYPGVELYPVTTSAYKTFTGCSSDHVGTFTSEKGFKGIDLYYSYCELLSKLPPNTAISFIKSKQPLDIFLKIQLRDGFLTEGDLTRLAPRIEVLFPRETKVKEFVAKKYDEVDIGKFIEILATMKDKEAMRILNAMKDVYPPDHLVEYFRTKAKDFRTGAFAADKSFSFDSGSTTLQEVNLRNYF